MPILIGVAAVACREIAGGRDLGGVESQLATNGTTLFAAVNDMPVKYTYTKEGDRMVVTRVTLAQPVSRYETKETTTTTTTKP